MNELVNYVPEIVVGAALIVASYTDIRTGKIYNNVTLPLIALGIFHHAMFSSEFALFGVLGFVAATVIHYTLWFLGIERGGDAKLLMGIGAFVGLFEILEISLWLAILYLPIGILTLVVLGRLGNFVALMKWHAVNARDPKSAGERPASTMLKTAPIIAGATIVAYFTDLLGVSS